AGDYAFEYLPKLFMGFWGWMGQPSLLLPAWIYGSLGVLCAASIIGLAIGVLSERGAARTEDDRQRRRARRLLAVGVVLMCGPILYGPVIAGRNLWYGHWLFPMLGPIAIAFVLGLTTIARLARLYPHRVAFVLAALSVFAAAFWLSGRGETMRAAIIANHYGDDERVLNSIRDAILALAVIAAAIEAWAYARRWCLTAPTATTVAAAMAALNGCLLVAFVRPLYAPVTPPEYVSLVTQYSAR